MTKPWPARLAAFILWALAAVSASFWFTKVSGTSRDPVTARTIASDIPTPQSADLARVFGPPGAGPASAGIGPGLPAAADPAARLRLLGVVANRAQVGVALIAVDGQPPRPYRVGSVLQGGWTLQKVGSRSATLASGDSGVAAVTIELAALPGAATGAGGKPPTPAPPRMPAAPGQDGQAAGQAPAAATVAAPAMQAPKDSDDNPATPVN